MAFSRIADLREHLESKGYEVYYPAQKVGECKRPYVVVKDEGLTQFQQFSSDIRLYAIMCYVPAARFGDLELMVDKLKEDMKPIYPMYVSTRFETPSFYDDEVKAYMISVQYRNAKKFYNH
jgi:hypothetical protein